MSRRAVLASAVAVAVLVVGGLVVGVLALVGPGSGTGAGSTPRAKVAAPAPALSTPAATAPATGHGRCAPVEHPFAPRTVAIPGVTRGADVLALPRDAQGVPGVPPLTSTGKTEFAWDRPPGISPGDPHGNVLLNAHTWPDGTALGNHLLAGLHEGDRIVVRGGSGARLCYRVTDRVQVPADAPGTRYYQRTGRPQLAIVVCSGRRLGPGDWTERTIWYASPTRG